MKSFQALQYQFAAHIRDPDTNPKPSMVDERRMAVYRELFFNNIGSFLSSGFPVLCSLYSEADWQAMTRDFLAHYQCQTPYFLEIAQQFLDYLEHQRQPQAADRPFMLELAHYEWVEMALMVAEETEADQRWSLVMTSDTWLSCSIALQSTAWLLSYNYPVQHIGPEFTPDEASQQPTFLLVYRDREDEVGFMVLNLLTAQLLSLIEQGGMTGQALLEQLHSGLPEWPFEQLQQGALEILMDLNRRNVLRIDEM